MDTAANKDTGFAWIVLIASFMGHFFQYGIVWTVGYFYVIFLEHFDGSKAAVALIASLNTAMYYCIGMFTFLQIINFTAENINKYWSCLSKSLYTKLSLKSKHPILVTYIHIL